MHSLCVLVLFMPSALHANPRSIIRNSIAICAAMSWVPVGYEADIAGVPQADPPLVFAKWSVYNPEGALNLKPQKAEWGLPPSGNYVMSK